MKLGVVIGVVWASRKVEALDACRMYIVQPVSSENNPVESPLVVADPKGLAASGDKIVYVTSTDAVEAFDSGFVPVNASVIELVDVVV